MRVSKPNSANNSPKSAIMQSRRRSFVPEGQAIRRQQQVLDYINTHYSPAQVRPARPVSWHPASHMQLMQPAYQQSAYPLLTPNMFDYQDMYMMGPQFSPMIESYSNDTSPSSTFSPLPLFPNDNMNYVPSTGMDVPHKVNNSQYAVPDQSYGVMGSQASGDWNNFIMTGFNSTSPPTPEAFPQSQQQQPHFAAVPDVSVVQEPAEEEEEGEVLVGMGLYDAPDKAEEDTQLNSYHSTVSSLLGSGFRPTEPTGKGLKLEETWEPPQSSEDGEDDDEDDE